MNITCSAEKGILKTEDCLACALADGNSCGYDYAVLKNMFGDSKQEARRNEIHVTDLTGCIRKAWYDKTCILNEYPHEMLTRWIGTKIHSAVEGSDKFMDSELPVQWDSLFGKSDIVYKDGRIVDIKCQPAGELVTMADGTEKNIEDIRIFDEVLSWNGEEFIPARVTAIMDGGVQDVYEIRVASGQILRASGNHPILTDRGWVQTEDLDVKADRVVQLFNWTGTNHIPAEDARLIGYLTGDGSTSQLYGVGFSNEDPEIIDDFTAICRTKDWDVTLAGPSCKVVYHITNRGKKLSTTGPKAFNIEYGLHGKHSWDKTVPDQIMSGDVETITNFLAGYFDTDGCITNPDGGLPPRLSITSVSEKLTDQVTELLRRIGIQCRRYASITTYQKPAYFAAVWRAADITHFGEIVPFRCEHKRERYEGWLPRMEQTSNKGKNMRRVDSVTNLGPMQTIGLEVEGTHTYISKGIITHNTTRWLMPAKVPYGSHVLQVNIYAFMLRKMGRDVSRLQIQYIDASGPTKCRACRLVARQYEGVYRCPSCGKELKNAHLGALLVEVPILRDDEVLERIQERKENLENAMAMGIAPEKEPGYLCSYCSHVDLCQPALTEEE